MKIINTFLFGFFCMIIYGLSCSDFEYNAKNPLLVRAPRQVTAGQDIVGGLIPSNQTQVIGEIKNLSNSFNGCCQELQHDFQGTFTELDALSKLLTSSSLFPCSSITITGPLTIEKPGSYCLANDIEGSIIINANNVVLDLNNHRITTNNFGDALVVNPGLNRVIKNGIITNSEWGIVLDGNATTLVHNIIISFCGLGGILVINAINLVLDSLVIEFPQFGILFLQSNNANLLKNIIVSQPQQGFVFEFLTNSILQNCEVLDGDSGSFPTIGTSNYGFLLFSGSNNQIDNCSVKTYSGLGSSSGFFIGNANNSILRNCLAQHITSFFPPDNAETFGFYCSELANNVQFLNCSAQDVHGKTLSSGFHLLGTNVILDSCSAQCATADTLASNANCFLCTGTNVALTQCQASCSFNGFTINNPTSLQSCQSTITDNGFMINDASSLIGNCVAYKNTIGFNAATTALAYRCFAAANSINNYVNIPNIQNANAQVDTSIVGPSGPIAGGNLFM